MSLCLQNQNINSWHTHWNMQTHDFCGLVSFWRSDELVPPESKHQFMAHTLEYAIPCSAVTDVLNSGMAELLKKTIPGTHA